MPQLITNLPVGANVKYGKHKINNEAPVDIVWTIADKAHSAYPANSITLLASNVIDIRAYDAKESGGPFDPMTYGNNHPHHSNLLQWLNSTGSPWFVKKHTYDVEPALTNVTGKTQYADLPGFLSNFTEIERNTIKTTTIETFIATVSSSSVSAKVFLPSRTEVGWGTEQPGYPEGKMLALFTLSSAARTAGVTTQCAQNSLGVIPVPNTSPISYWLRTPVANTGAAVRAVDTNGEITSSYAYNGENRGVRPIINIPDTLLVSDQVDSDGAYTVVWNNPPKITPVGSNLGDKQSSFALSYSVTDASGDTYTITEKLDGELVSTVTGQTGTVSRVLDLATRWPALAIGPHSVTIEAVDQLGDKSSQTYSFNKTNSAPTISGVDSHLGPKSSSFNIDYSVGDTDATDNLTIVEKLNDVTIRTIPNAIKGNQYTIPIDVSKMSLGEHIVTISVTDTVGNITTRTYRFTLTFRKMYAGEINSPITLTTAPIAIDAMEIPIMVTGVLPEGPNLAVLGQGPDAETILYSEVSPNTNSIKVLQRGFEGEAKAWPSGTVVARNFTNYDYITMVDNIEAMHKTVENAHLNDIHTEFIKIKSGVVEIKNVSIPTSAWVLDSTLGLYKASYTNAIISPEHVPYVNINTIACVKAANDASVSTFVESTVGKITMYAEIVPSIALTCNIQLIKEVV